MDRKIRDSLSVGEITMLHIFIVSLQQDVEKRAAISKILNEFNLDFTFIDAVYGKELSTDYLHSLRNNSSGKLVDRGFPATPGEIGCTLSHLKAYQEVLNRGLEWACILEDDAILDIRFKKFINDFDSKDLNPLNLYLLGGQTPNSKKYIIKSIKNVRKVGGQNFYKTIGSDHIIYRTCCYLISSNLAKNIISLGNDELILADDWGYLVEKGSIRSIYLSDFVEHPIDLTDSHIQKEREAAVSISETLNRPVKLGRKINNAIRWRLRFLALKAYRFIERKDRL